jgi:hypothetical protein
VKCELPGESFKMKKGLMRFSLELIKIRRLHFREVSKQKVKWRGCSASHNNVAWFLHPGVLVT